MGSASKEAGQGGCQQNQGVRKTMVTSRRGMDRWRKRGHAASACLRPWKERFGFRPVWYMPEAGEGAIYFLAAFLMSAAIWSYTFSSAW